MQKSSTIRFVYYQFAILFLLILGSFLNEAVDLPHYIFGDPPTMGVQRIGEMILEAIMAVGVVILEIIFIMKLRRDIRILKGFIPICASCKKIRQVEDWQPLEKYISDHSMAMFAHAICPDCMKKLYPKINLPR